MAGANGRRKAPAYQWYPGDWATSESVQVMTWAERGMYREILDYQWMNGDVPADLRRLSRLIGATMEELEAAWRSALRACFEVSEDGERMWNPRLRREQDIRAEFRSEQKERSEAAHDKRWGPKCAACGKRQGPVADPCQCYAGGHAAGHAGGHAGGDAKSMPPVPSRPVPSLDDDARAEELPEHVRRVATEYLAAVEPRISQRAFSGKGALHRLQPHLFSGALRARVLAFASDATPTSQPDLERQQVAVRDALRKQKPEARIVELLERAEKGPGEVAYVKKALREITEGGV